MDVLYPRCSGIDVHKRFVVACLSCVQANGSRRKEVRQFSTMTNEIVALKEWLKAAECRPNTNIGDTRGKIAILLAINRCR